MLVLTRNHRD